MLEPLCATCAWLWLYPVLHQLGEKQEQEQKRKEQEAAEAQARSVDEALDHAAATAEDPAVRQALQNKRLRDMLMDPAVKVGPLRLCG